MKSDQIKFKTKDKNYFPLKIDYSKKVFLENFGHQAKLLFH